MTKNKNSTLLEAIRLHTMCRDALLRIGQALSVTDDHAQSAVVRAIDERNNLIAALSDQLPIRLVSSATSSKRLQDLDEVPSAIDRNRPGLERAFELAATEVSAPGDISLGLDKNVIRAKSSGRSLND